MRCLGTAFKAAASRRTPKAHNSSIDFGQYRSCMSQDRLDASLDIDRRSTLEIIRIIQQQDALVAPAVATQAERIAHAVDEIANRMSHGGRLFYVGAGTSGRIAMLDAAELPPTFGIDPSLVRVLMAGGERAFFSAVEGAEDDEEDAIATVEREVVADDAVVGIAASGTTPYTVAAIRKAKSGTAQKLVLNAISTAVMIRLGHVYSNLMIDMPATNEKLRSRAVRMVELAANVTRPIAVQALRDANGSVKLATVMARKRIAADEARKLLEGRNLREVLEA